MPRREIDPNSAVAGRVGPDTAFHDVIEAAYRVFSAPRPVHLGVCTCGMCMGPDAATRLLATPSRQWTLADIWSWSESVEQALDLQVWTWLLPRFLEVIASGETCNQYRPELSLARWPTGQPAQWSDKQWAVLERFKGLLLERAMQRRFGPSMFEELRLMIYGGWSAHDIAMQAAEHPRVFGALIYAWGHGWTVKDPFEGPWPDGVWDVLREVFITQDIADGLLRIGLENKVNAERSRAALDAAEVVLDRL